MTRWRRLGGAVCLVLSLGAARADAASQWRLEASTWVQPRSAEAVLRMDPVASAVRAWHRASSATLVIRYPGGEEGTLWAAQLHDWLVALGIPSDRIERVPGGEPGGLGLDVREGEGQ